MNSLIRLILVIQAVWTFIPHDIALNSSTRLILISLNELNLIEYSIVRLYRLRL